MSQDLPLFLSVVQRLYMLFRKALQLLDSLEFLRTHILDQHRVCQLHLLGSVEARSLRRAAFKVLSLGPHYLSLELIH